MPLPALAVAALTTIATSVGKDLMAKHGQDVLSKTIRRISDFLKTRKKPNTQDLTIEQRMISLETAIPLFEEALLATQASLVHNDAAVEAAMASIRQLEERTLALEKSLAFHRILTIIAVLAAAAVGFTYLI